MIDDAWSPYHKSYYEKQKKFKKKFSQISRNWSKKFLTNCSNLVKLVIQGDIFETIDIKTLLKLFDALSSNLCERFNIFQRIVSTEKP